MNALVEPETPRPLRVRWPCLVGLHRWELLTANGPDATDGELHEILTASTALSAWTAHEPDELLYQRCSRCHAFLISLDG